MSRADSERQMSGPIEPRESGVAPTTRVARSRACVGNPPRQVEDPMSPPCVATIFDGDNGGTTSKGVTSTEIVVAVPHGGLGPDFQAATQSLFDFFNLRFELYGRRLRPLFVPYGSVGTPTQARATGADIAGRQPFAALGGIAEWYDVHPAFYQELARQHVVTVARGAGYLLSDRTMFDEGHPYLWSTQASSEDWQRNAADLACRSLAGHLPSGEAAGSSTRVFGVVAMGSQEVPSSRVLDDGLASCGIEPAPRKLAWASTQARTALRTGLQAFKDAGVTTILCVCAGANVLSPFYEAQQVGYQPEWVVQPTLDNNDESTYQSIYSPWALGTVIQLSSAARLLPYQVQPWFQAMIATNPDPLGNAPAGRPRSPRANCCTKSCCCWPQASRLRARR